MRLLVAWGEFLFLYLSKNVSSFNQDWMPIDKYNSLASKSLSRAIFSVCGPGNILNLREAGLYN